MHFGSQHTTIIGREVGMKRLILTAILSVAPFSFVHAYTECNVVLTRVLAAVDGNFYIATGSYLNGMLEYTPDPGYKNAVAIAIAARASGAPVLVRYLNDGVVCGSAAWSERIIAIGM
jgi:hypothetical protein